MPLGAARITFLAKSQVTAAAEVIRKQIGVSAIGNAQVDTAEYKYGGSSARFDGVGDYLDLSSQNIDMSGDWTFETWINSNVIGSSDVILRIHNTSDAFVGSLYVTNGKIATYIGGGGTTGTTVMSSGTWYHLAWVRDSGTIRMYINGVQDATRAYAVDGERKLYIGHVPSDANTRFNGWMEDMRLSNTARYPDGTSFTSPSANLVNDNNTLFLIHGHGTDASTTFIDDNGTGRSAVGIIADDNAQIDNAQSKFGGTSAVFPSTYGWLQTGAVNAFAVSGDWTKEFWVYYNKNSADQYIHHNRGGYSSGSFNVYTPSVGNVRAAFNDGGTTRNINTTFSTGQWYHYAFVNNGGTITWYVNGSSVGTASWSSTINDPDKTLRWGAFSAGGTTDKFEGWIDEYRFSDTARYTSGFTPSTTPFVNDANTLLLLHMDGTDGNTDFFDDNGVRAPVGISAIGNAQVDTAQSQFSGASLFLDGSGDYLNCGTSTDFNLGSNDFTLECWINPSSINTAGAPMQPLFNKYKTSTSQRSYSFGIYDGFLGYFWASSGSSGNVVQTTQAISTGAWKHIALVREGNTWSVYYDGNRVDSRTLAVTLFNSSEPLLLGSYFGTASNEYHGYADEFRVSNTARYTGTTYTVPTEPFQNDDNTLLLLHCNGTDGSTVFLDDNGLTTAGTGA